MSGCTHYKRTCKFLSPCCGKIYPCRFCHDANEYHKIDRKAIKKLICTNCNTRQAVQTKCQQCNTYFGKYTCLECRLFDDEFKNQYHCYGCGFCRIGGRDNFFHCEKCNFCFPLTAINNHKCIENISGSSCPICLEEIRSSRITYITLTCGHILHDPCLQQLKNSNHLYCPICKHSINE